MTPLTTTTTTPNPQTVLFLSSAYLPLPLCFGFWFKKGTKASTASRHSSGILSSALLLGSQFHTWITYSQPQPINGSPYWDSQWGLCSTLPQSPNPIKLYLIIQLNKVSSRPLRRGSCSVSLLCVVNQFYHTELSVYLAVLASLLNLLWAIAFPSLLGPSQKHIRTDWGLLPHVKWESPRINKLSHIQFCNSLRWVQK